MAPLPKTMRSLIAPTPTGTKDYTFTEMPTPSITKPTQVIVRSYAVAAGGSEVLQTAGQLSILHKLQFPYKIGMEGAGTVAAIGSAVKSFKPGDEVYAISVGKPMFRDEVAGWGSQYAITEERFLMRKPPGMSFEEAASLPGDALTLYAGITRGLAMRGLESMEGMTVFVPAGLGGLGSIGVQMAKKVFGAEKVITTVSTPKVALVKEYLPGIVDQVIDYQTQSLKDHIPAGSVDFVLSTQWSTLTPSIPLLNPSSGILISYTSIPTKKTITEALGADGMPIWLGMVLDLAQWYYWWLFRGTNIAYEMVSGDAQDRKRVEAVEQLISDGKIKGVYEAVDMNDMEAVKAGFERVAAAKGGIGKFVVRIP